MEFSETLDKFAPAMVKVQTAIGGAVKGNVNPHFKSKYADLASVWEACRVPLTDNGLAVIQAPGLCANGHMEMTTMLLHSSGQYMRETLSIPLTKVDAQGYGSATTYARRYALAAMVSVCPEDDDGNAASQRRPVDSSPVSPEQLEVLLRVAGEVEADKQKFCQYFKVNSLAAIPASEFDRAVAALESKRKKESVQ